MDTMKRHKIQSSIRDVLVILDSAPLYGDMMPDLTSVRVANRMPIAHLGIEIGLKARIEKLGKTYKYDHGLDKQYGDIDNDWRNFLTAAFDDAVEFFGYDIGFPGFEHFCSLDEYLTKVGKHEDYINMRYWVIEGKQIPDISPPIHRELLRALLSLFLDRRETISDRVEREVGEAMFMGRNISYSLDDTSKEQSVRRYMDWLKKHTTRRDALKEAVDQNFVIGDDFANQTALDAYNDLRQSKDPAVQYYIRKLSYLLKVSQPRNPDAIPEIEWTRQDKTLGMVTTPAGRTLGFIERHADGAWGITPSEEGLARVTDIAEALADAKAYLVNRLTNQVTVTVNGESKQLRMVGELVHRELGWTSEPPFTYDIEF